MRELILNLAIREIQSAVELSCLVHAKLFEHLMRSPKLEDEDKVVFLIRQIKAGIAKGAVKSAFEQLGMNNFKELLDGKGGEVTVSSTNEQILEVLLQKKWILNYEVDSENTELFKVHVRMAQKKKKEVIDGK